MKLSMRWFGASDPVTLPDIAQVPGVDGIVSGLYDLPAGEVWTHESLGSVKQQIEDGGFRFEVIESIPVHEQIKLGTPERNRYIDNYCESLSAAGEAGIPVVCYNFMPIFDWTRTNLAEQLPDGSTALSYRHADVASIDPLAGDTDLPGWAAAYTKEELRELFDAYKPVDESALWDNLAYFLERVIPAAESAGVKMGIHPDDPPWSIFGLPRIITDKDALQRVINLVDSPANGLTFCTGSLGANPKNNLPQMVRQFGEQGRIHFAHCRNIQIKEYRTFHESPHPQGSLDLYGVMKAYFEVGFHGAMRSDHGRMIWNDKGLPGYGLYDRALGSVYLSGLWEGIARENGRIPTRELAHV
ncbi:MAG: mannonate dehydratase [Fuerstiella sp.]|nr:mannonate dehydratase [Fuerstiella sp.]MCP4856874.1 mannonate dehydratase [Fuerstiella sp.]